MIASTAVIDPSAIIADDVEIGPFSVIGPNVEIGSGTRIGPHVTIAGPTRIGKNNRIYQFSSIGEDPQDMKFHEEETHLEIGDGNVIREFCTINRGTGAGGGITRLGNENWIMAYVHIAHDCIVGNNNIFANGASLAGHVVVEDHAVLGGFTLVTQFCRLGSYSFFAATCHVIKDIPPFIKVSGPVTIPRSINVEGLRRHGFDSKDLSVLKQAYRLLFRAGLNTSDALSEIRDTLEQRPVIEKLVRFIEESDRGIIRPLKRSSIGE